MLLEPTYSLAGADLRALDEKSSCYAALLWAASTGNTRIAYIVMNSDPEFISVTDSEDIRRFSTFNFEGHIATARPFIEAGDTPNGKCKYGSPLLAWAIPPEHVDIAITLP